jgi:hypothetical protein
MSDQQEKRELIRTVGRRDLLTFLAAGALAAPVAAFQVVRPEDQPDEEIIVIGKTGSTTGSINDTVLQSKFEAGRLADKLMAGGAVLVIIGGAVIMVGGNPVGIGIAAAGGFAWFVAGWLYAYSNDPPQPNFARPVIATPLNVQLPPATANPYPDLARAVRCSNTLAPVVRGMLDAVERLKGADAAGNASWRSGHKDGHDFLGACLVTRMNQLARAYVDASKVPALNLSYTAASLQAKARKLTIPPYKGQFSQAMAGVGFEPEAILALNNMLLNYNAGGQPLGYTKNLFQSMAQELTTSAKVFDQAWYVSG